MLINVNFATFLKGLHPILDDIPLHESDDAVLIFRPSPAVQQSQPSRAAAEPVDQPPAREPPWISLFP